MCEDVRDKFMEWHQMKVNAGAEFNFDKEIIEYCRNDVTILRKAVLKFRSILMDITGKEEHYVDENNEPQVELKNAICPYDDITIASVCSRVYRTKFLREKWEVQLQKHGHLSDWLPAEKVDDNFSVSVDGNWLNEKDLQFNDYAIEQKRFVSSPIAQVPSNGYNHDQYSNISIKWLEWCMEKSRRNDKPIEIQHALTNTGEYHLPGTRYRLDGYCAATNTAYEFLGCLYHGCPMCYKTNRRVMKLPRTKQSLDELFALTIKKKEYIKSLGMKYVEIWEHEFQNMIAKDQEANKYVNNLDIQDRLNARTSFLGGRTNGIKLKYVCSEHEKIKYVDFTSLYPFVNKYCRYPVGHPDIITSGLDDLNLDKYFGIAKIKVLPPRKLYFPVLPLKCNGKLTFPLCKTCAENQNQNTCQCSDDERSFVGTYCTPEISKAESLGYEILRIYEVYHFPETTQYDAKRQQGGLFADYINLFLKIKQQSSGKPSWIKTEEDVEKYLRTYFEKEGIKLERNNIRKNKALRSLAKLLLNSFWGKFGQRLNMSQTGFFHEAEADKFFQCISDPKKQVKDFQIISNDTIQVTWENSENFIQENLQANIFIATFTTCWARLKLYSVLEMLQERTLYFDTDSVIYVSRPGDPEPELGDFLGELTSELDVGDHIVSFVTGGPKAYSYVTFKGNQICKCRGFSLNYKNKKLLNFDSMFELITSNPDGAIPLVNPSKISRHKLKRKIYNKLEEKKYKIVYTKRVIQKDSYDTLPYGY